MSTAAAPPLLRFPEPPTRSAERQRLPRGGVGRGHTTFIYVNAGHPPPFHLAPDGTATRLDQGGPVLGPLPDATYDRGFVHLLPGDILVMFTDGIVEAPRAGGESKVRGEEYGVDRLIELVRKHRDLSAPEIVEKIFVSAADWTGGAPPADDRTVLLVKNPG